MFGLNDRLCSNAKCDQQAILKLADGGGLYLWVYADGRKYWRFRYRHGGKENSLSLGVYPDVSIEEARSERDKLKDQLNNGLDPSQVRKDAKRHANKPLASHNQFRLSLSDDGSLTIETPSKIVGLTRPQTDALRAFLLAVEGG